MFLNDSGIKEEIKNTSFRMIFMLSILLCVFYYAKDHYVYNMTSSIPKGFYKIYNVDKKLEKGDIVVFNISLKDRKFMLERGYISGRTKALIKKVVGVEGDKIEIGKELKINGQIIKSLPDFDTLGRKLPKKSGEFILKEGEYFVIGDNIKSYDSSYLGIIRDSQFLKKAKLVINTDENENINFERIK